MFFQEVSSEDRKKPAGRPPPKKRLKRHELTLKTKRFLTRRFKNAKCKVVKTCSKKVQRLCIEKAFSFSFGGDASSIDKNEQVPNESASTPEPFEEETAPSTKSEKVNQKAFLRMGGGGFSKEKSNAPADSEQSNQPLDSEHEDDAIEQPNEETQDKKGSDADLEEKQSAETSGSTEKALDEEDLEYFQVKAPTEGQSYFEGKVTVHSNTLIRIVGPSGVSMAGHLPAFRRILENILQDRISQALPHEHLQVIIGCKRDDHDYLSTKFFKVADDPTGITMLMALIQNSVASGARWVIDDEIELTIKHVRNQPPIFSGKGDRYIATEGAKQAKERRCMCLISNKDHMCMPRSTIIIQEQKRVDLEEEKNKASKSPILDKLKKDLKALKRPCSARQEQLARELCEKAGLDPSQPCSHTEARKIENALGIYIKIVAFDLMNKLVL